MIMEVRQDPGNCLEKMVEIEPGKHKYVCHEIPLGLRPVRVFVYIKGARENWEMGREDILPAEIRTNKKLELNCSRERGVAITPTSGNFIPRLGFVIILKRVAQQIKSLGN